MKLERESWERRAKIASEDKVKKNKGVRESEWGIIRREGELKAIRFELTQFSLTDFVSSCDS